MLQLEERQRIAALDRPALESYQLARVNQLLADILPANGFYAEKLAQAKLPLASFDEFRRLGFTYKEDLQEASPHRLPSVNLTYPLERYVRYHQTSGTRGRPLAVLDTAEDWAWWLDAWQYVLDSVGVEPGDRVMLAFSFGPFIGFWSAHEACVARGALVIPAGGLSSQARLELMRATKTTVVFSTPSYALHLAEVAQSQKQQVSDLGVRVIVLAGEPGGSVPSTRARLAEAWQADVVDHAGASEVGPWGLADERRTGLHINEAEFIAEFLSLTTGGPASEGELSELVLTGLGRKGYPVIRYRTGDLVRPTWNHDRSRRFVFLEGGVLGRNDDMLTIRAVNVFPSAIEQILRSFPEVHEFRLIARRVSQMDELTIEIEDQLGEPQRVAVELQMRLGLRVDVRCVPLGSLPRFEGKGKRFVDQR